MSLFCKKGLHCEASSKQNVALKKTRVELHTKNYSVWQRRPISAIILCMAEVKNQTENRAPKIILSGVKPTGRPHIGNYFGAMKQFVDLQNSAAYSEKDVLKFFMIADYHGLNFIQDASKMREYILDLAIDYLAIGIDPDRSVIFKQSDISAHTELAWIFDTITSMPYLMRAHAFKDAEAKNKEISVGAFNYPVLMAADILLYGTDIVPVGQDQKQHVEYTRDIAQKFNSTFTQNVFKLPEPLIMKDVATVPGTTGQKMSKSYGNTIPLFATSDEIKQAVMSIVTDSGVEGIPKNVYNIHKLIPANIRSAADIEALYAANKGKYKPLKEALIADLETFIKPLRDHRAKIASEPQKVIDMLSKNAIEARKHADRTLEQVKKAIGVTL